MGVFVNEKIDIIIEKIEKYQLNCVQLHGNESLAFCEELKKKINTNIEIIKVFLIDEHFNFNKIKTFENLCNYFLFDTKGKLPGGNGTTFNWDLLKNYSSDKPFFLSGGIGLKEIEKIKAMKLPIYALDINSKFETKPGMKNVARCQLANLSMRQLIKKS